MTEIKGRWFILVPMILYAIFMLWSYFPIITYISISLIVIILGIALNVTIFEQYYKPYYDEVRYYENYVKGRYHYIDGIEEQYLTKIAILKAEYDKWKYYYIGFWWQMFYDYIIVPPCNVINYLFNQLVKVCIYVDEKLTIKI